MSATPAGVSVRTIVRDQSVAPDLSLDVVAGSEGLDRVVTLPYSQKTGLALAGYDEYLKPGRVLVLGASEVHFLERLEPAARTAVARRLFGHDVPCLMVTNNLALPPEVTAEADRSRTPVLRTRLTTPLAMARLTARLEFHLAPRTIVHGVLLDILGLGVLLVGESGIGKSESALELVARGHRLVADDTVEVHRRAEGVVIGTCPALTRHHMELRGLGVVNVRDLFGVAATRTSKRVELVVQLERWEGSQDYERLGLDERTYELLGVAVPLVRMPVAPGRNVAMLVEVAARHQLLRARGRHTARELAARIDRRLEQAPRRRAPESTEEEGDGS
jgi:HPr kinase/phosphorylase